MTQLKRQSPLRDFVRSAWALLAFQLLAAACAVAVTGWAAFQVRPLLAERERLAREIDAAQSEVDDLEASKVVLTAENAELAARAAALRKELKGARDSTPALNKAITAFHAKDYADAIVKYDKALDSDPGNAYIHNLKSYSQFKARDYDGAVRTITRALEIDPTYDWGYLDLARYQCAAGSPQLALATVNKAIGERGLGVRHLLGSFLEKDGEFRRVCADVTDELRSLVDSDAAGLPQGDARQPGVQARDHQQYTAVYDFYYNLILNPQAGDDIIEKSKLLFDGRFHSCLNQVEQRAIAESQQLTQHCSQIRDPVDRDRCTQEDEGTKRAMWTQSVRAAIRGEIRWSDTLQAQAAILTQNTLGPAQWELIVSRTVPVAKQAFVCN